MKLIGACILLFSATMLGFHTATRYAKRPQQIRELGIALQLLETEICYGATALPLALDYVSKRARGEVGRLFQQAAQRLLAEDGRSTAECWEQAVEQVWSSMTMKKAEKEIMLHLGSVLGKSEKEDQRKHIRLTLMNLQQEEMVARDEQQKYEKMCRSLGILGGILAVILMY
ncbi:stage III sporulation protein AB [Ammoniphilus oxalaticus]|uniref:Stage III sporulation protein AB n=1 Tax=Ammoniphilus oxalaticus TaxID=66863 RepID=A0A419SMP6_9BACL|nr:stage III sporulation protein SpoIIIAB [Ammoniphilus oxalaticus]RKD25570.1 stage III sporulation protein AB [Ammoniphilus oxalaticus]